MASFSGRMSVKKFEGEFFSTFSVFSDIMKDGKPAPNDATLASLRPEGFVGAKGGKFKPNGNMKVKNVKRNFNETFGLDIRLYQIIEADQDATLASLLMDRGGVEKRSGEFSVLGRMKVGKFQDDFESAFGVLIRVLDKNNPAAASASIASIRIDGFDGSKKADFKIGGGMKVRNVIRSLLEKIGINVQIIQLQEADDSMTMASLKKVGLFLSEENNLDKEEEGKRAMNKAKYLEALEKVKKDGKKLEYVPDELKTDELCLEAVKQNGLALEYVLDELKTDELCLEAVKQDGLVLEDVPEELKTDVLCLEAVKNDNDGWVLDSVPKELKTHEICLEAVKHNGNALDYVPEELKTHEICLEAVKEWGGALNYVPEELKTYEICLEAVKQDGDALVYVPEELKKAVEQGDELQSDEIPAKKEYQKRKSVDLVRLEIQTNIVKYSCRAEISGEDYRALENGEKSPYEIADQYNREFELDFDRPGNDETKYSWEEVTD